MTMLQIGVEETLKEEADILFDSLGLDTATAVRIFLKAAVERDGIPFPVSHRVPTESLLEAMEDARTGRNLIGPFHTAEEAVASMLED